MTLVSTADLLADAYARGTGLAALNVITLEHAEGTVLGAEQAGLPVVLQVSENAAKFHLDDPAPLTAALLALARSAQVDVSLHLDHVTRVDLLHRTAECGFSSVMFDAGPLPYEENVAATREAVAWGHEHGLLVEAELGYVGGKASQERGQVESAHGSGVRTDPDQAADVRGRDRRRRAGRGRGQPARHDHRRRRARPGPGRASCVRRSTSRSCCTARPASRSRRSPPRSWPA